MLRIAASLGDVELWACTQSFADAEHILRRAVPTSTLRNMMNGCLSFLHVAAPSEKALSAGLQSDWLDLEDFLIAQCAHEQGVHYLITRDVKGFAKSRIPVNPLTNSYNLPKKNCASRMNQLIVSNQTFKQSNEQDSTHYSPYKRYCQRKHCITCHQIALHHKFNQLIHATQAH